MRAITVRPGTAGSAQLEDVPEPPREAGSVLVEAEALGVCGTDREIVGGAYGSAPPGAERLVLGHESLGRVLEAPEGCALSPGALVVGIVRRPDPEPCPCCARGEWDMCRNGRYTEHGIKELHGYAAERWRVTPELAVPVASPLDTLGVLIEPTSVVAKAWEQIDRIGARACSDAERVLVTGAGPIGLLAALLARQRGFDVHVLDHVSSGSKPELVRSLGATYHNGSVAEAIGEGVDIIVEATGAATVVLDALGQTRPGGIVCLTGISSGGRTTPVDAGALNRELVLGNHVVFGSVNANRRHYEAAATALAEADQAWLAGLITRRVPLSLWHEALEQRDGDIKVVLDFTST